MIWEGEGERERERGREGGEIKAEGEQVSEKKRKIESKANILLLQLFNCTSIKGVEWKRKVTGKISWV